MAATVTVTGTAGPGITVTAQVWTGVRNYSIDCLTNMIAITKENGFVDNISIAAATTITATKSGSTYALTIS